MLQVFEKERREEETRKEEARAREEGMKGRGGGGDGEESRNGVRRGKGKSERRVMSLVSAYRNEIRNGYASVMARGS